MRVEVVLVAGVGDVVGDDIYWGGGLTVVCCRVEGGSRGSSGGVGGGVGGVPICCLA